MNTKDHELTSSQAIQEWENQKLAGGTHEFEPDIAGLQPHRCKRLDCGLRSSATVHSVNKEKNNPNHELDSSRQNVDSAPALLPCPFCDGSDLLLTDQLSEDREWNVFCHDCGGGSGWKRERQNAIMAWNTRANSHEELTKERDRLLQVLETRAEQWQPIETAPKDGDLIFISAGNNWTGTGYWDCEQEDEGGQCWRWYEPDRERIEPLPTYWMPLPAPPNTQRNNTSALDGTT